MSNTEKIKPCFMCESRNIQLHEVMMYDPIWKVRCRDCTTVGLESKISLDAAIILWNTPLRREDIHLEMAELRGVMLALFTENKIYGVDRHVAAAFDTLTIKYAPEAGE